MTGWGTHSRDNDRPWRVKTLRGGLLLVVIAALLPMAILSVWQGRAAFDAAQVEAIVQLRDDAMLIAEAERDVFVVARQTLRVVGSSQAIRTIGDGCSDRLVDAHRQTMGIINLTRSDRSGRIRCSALPFNGTESFAQAKWWQRAIAAEGFTLSTPAIGTISKRPILVIAFRIAPADGGIDGLVTAGISLEALRASLEKRRALDPEALIEIVDRNGAIVISNRKVALQLSPAALSDRKPGSIRSRDGTQWLYATAALHGKDLTIVYAKPRDDVLATALWQARQSIWLPLLTMALASLAIWVGGQWFIVRWLHKIRALAAQFGQGDFSGQRAEFADAPREVAALSNDLHAMVETIEARDTALTAALNAKDVLVREVNHRVKNNLQIVTSLLTLQADRVADDYARDALGQARARIAALGLIHRILYEHDTYNDLGTVNIRLLLAELCPQLRTANRGQADIDLRFESHDIELTVDQSVPLTLFIVEAVTNAFRHGYADGQGGRIGIAMTVEDRQVQLSVTDDGNGYAVADTAARMGFELMNGFATQLDGTVVTSSTQSGTTVKLSYPLTQS